jgi:hypothetical protein
MTAIPEPGSISATSANRVTVVDIQMPFGSMVVFMVKWAIAAIPAAIILVVLAVFLTGVVGGIFSSATTIRSVANRAAERGDTTPYPAALLLESATEEQRQQILRSEIKDAKKECREVTSVERAGTTGGGRTIWNVSCFQGPNYVVVVSATGSVTVTER